MNLNIVHRHGVLGCGLRNHFVLAQVRYFREHISRFLNHFLNHFLVSTATFQVLRIHFTSENIRKQKANDLRVFFGDLLTEYQCISRFFAQGIPD